MTWRDVVRRDLTSAYRSRLGPGVAIALVLSTFGAVGLMAFLADPRYPPGMDGGVTLLGSVLSFVVPLAALVGAYSAIVGERTTGSVRFLLGLPNSRGEAFAGKFLSRAVVVVAPLTVGMVAAGVVVVTFFENGSFVATALLGLISALYAMLFVGLGLTASSLADTDTQAVALAVGAFALFRAGWPAVQWFGLWLHGSPYPRPDWYFWFGRVNPINAYVKLTTAFGEVGYHPLLTHPNDVDVVATTEGFSFAVLVVWTLLAPVAGFVYFRRRDLL